MIFTIARFRFIKNVCQAVVVLFVKTKLQQKAKFKKIANSMKQNGSLIWMLTLAKKQKTKQKQSTITMLCFQGDSNQ